MWAEDDKDKEGGKRKEKRKGGKRRAVCRN